MNKIVLPLISAIAICAVLNAAASRAESKSSIAQQFIVGHHSVAFSIIAPYSDDEKTVEGVRVTCDESKCRVRVESISQHACVGDLIHQGKGFLPRDELIQTNEYGPEEAAEIFRPKVTAGEGGMLIVQYIDSGREVRLRIFLKWEKSALPSNGLYIASGGVVGEEELVFSPPTRFAPVVEIVGSPIICHARFQSR